MFSIVDLHELEPRLCEVRVEFQGSILLVWMRESLETLSKLRTGFGAEMDFQTVLRIEDGLPCDAAPEGVFPTDDPLIYMVEGTICHQLEIGPEYFICVLSLKESGLNLSFGAERSLKIGGRTRVVVRGLELYPTFT